MTAQTFLGRGWHFPPTFTQGGGAVEMVEGHEDIAQCLNILLATSLDERVMQEGFGCDLQSLLFAEIDQSLVNNISMMITDSILYHEPRIKLDHIDVSQSQQQQGLLMITIAYTVRNTNSRFNMVYPFYINEASLGAM